MSIWTDIAISSIEYIEYSKRFYGQPKLVKPKELKNINSIGSVEFVPNHCNPQIFIKDDDTWIKHADYFSAAWRPPEGERIDMPLSYYVNKYFNKNKKEKFVYADGWGDIVLRNEAWLKITNVVGLIRKCNYNRYQTEYRMAHEILNKQISKLGFEDYSCEWERYWENVMRFVNKYLYEHKNDVVQLDFFLEMT